MAFNRLIWNCFHQQTNLGEGALRVTHAPAACDRILFFRVDCAAGRAALGIPDDEPICDGVVFHRHEKDRPTLLLVELKGSDLRHAVKQINRVYQAINKMLPADCSITPRPKIKALVVLAGSAPPDQKKALDVVEKGITVMVKSGMRNKPLALDPYFY